MEKPNQANQDGAGKPAPEETPKFKISPGMVMVAGIAEMAHVFYTASLGAGADKAEAAANTNAFIIACVTTGLMGGGKWPGREE